jgi:hypothetical protein
MNAVEIIPADNTFETYAFIGGLIRGFFRKAPARAAGHNKVDGAIRIELDSEELGRFMVAAATRATRDGFIAVPFDIIVSA